MAPKASKKSDKSVKKNSLQEKGNYSTSLKKGSKGSVSANSENLQEYKTSASLKNIPDRYLIKEVSGRRVLACFESPNISVYIERGVVHSSSAAKKSPSGTIFLDGAAQGSPFLEHERMVYNFDHHEGCIRTITVSTCEQTMIMIMKGLDLRKQEWKIYANDPDLDTLFAIWVLLNHLRLGDAQSRVRRTVMPIIRLEGTIDAHGLEYMDYTGYPEEFLSRTMKILETLQSEEIRLKKEGKWNEIDYLEYAAGILRKIDQIVYRAGEFMHFQEIEELAQLPIYQNRIAVVCSSDAGIYETEIQLKRIYGTRLALIILRKDESNYTLRQTDLFLPLNLEDVYERLNIYDPNVSGHRPENRWGGSTDIGGSPRREGTRLEPREILGLTRQVFQKPGIFYYLKHAARAFGIGSLVLFSGWMARLNWFSERWFSPDSFLFFQNSASGFLITTGFLGLFFLLFFSSPRKRYRFYGFHLPVGWKWLFLSMLGILVGTLGGAWTPWIEPNKSNAYSLLFHIILMPFSAEVIFRGLIYGLLIPGNRVQSSFSRWFVSRPVLFSSIFYAFVLLIPYSPFLSIAYAFPSDWAVVVLLRFLFGFAFGIFTGMIRERSESIWAAYLTHLLATLFSLILYNSIS